MREVKAIEYPCCSWPRGLEKLIFEASLAIPKPSRELFVSAASGDDDLLFSKISNLLEGRSRSRETDHGSRVTPG